MRMILHSFYQRMPQSRLSSIFIPCLRKLRTLDLISPSLKVCGWVVGLAIWISLWLWTGLRLNLRFLGFMWAWAISRRTTGVLEFVLLKKTLLSWRLRNLSFRGKALVINALALSRIWYVPSLVHMPLWVLRMLNSLIFDLVFLENQMRASVACCSCSTASSRWVLCR